MGVRERLHGADIEAARSRIQLEGCGNCGDLNSNL